MPAERGMWTWQGTSIQQWPWPGPTGQSLSFPPPSMLGLQLGLKWEEGSSGARPGLCLSSASVSSQLSQYPSIAREEASSPTPLSLWGFLHISIYIALGRMPVY